MKANYSSNDHIIYKSLDIRKQYELWKGNNSFLFNGMIYIWYII